MHGLNLVRKTPFSGRRRGNPNWGKLRVESPAKATQWEIESEGIPESQWLKSAKLREWAKRNRNHRYIPEFALKHWGIRVDESIGEM